MLKGEHRVYLALFSGGVFYALLQRHGAALTHGKHIPVSVGLFGHLLKKLMYGRHVAHMLGGENVAVHVHRAGGVGQSLGLAEEIDNVHAEAVRSPLEPPVHHGVYLVPDLRVFPVQIRLSF